MHVEILPLVGDNYVYLLVDSDSAAVVDPTEAEGVLSLSHELDVRLSLVILTHHHNDHTGGCSELKRRGCTIVGPDDSRISPLDERVADGDRVAVGNGTLQVISVPGHTRSHLAYYSSEDAILFTGDTLFACGCGRLFEGTADEMWSSMKKLRGLPEDTAVYCGHDYTLDNVEFALHIEPDNPNIKKRLKETRDLVRAGLPTVPSSIAIEKATNPFLRADCKDVADALRLSSSEPQTVFAELRSRKDRW
jgi:hydroxyacylglutathione hydrolase